MPMDDAEYNSHSKTPKRDEHGQANLKSKLRDTVLPSFLKGKMTSHFRQRLLIHLKLAKELLHFWITMIILSEELCVLLVRKKMQVDDEFL